MIGVRHDLIPLVLLLCFCVSHGEDPRALPCPNPDDIYPCVCHFDSNYDMEMDCSLVTSENQLARIFSADLPFTNFKILTIEQNNYLKVLRKGDLGQASFQEIYINGGILEEVEEEALIQSFASAEIINLPNNRISAFPFQDLPSFSSLHTLFLTGNSLSFLPPLQSSSLQVIGMSENLFTQIPVDSFKGVTNIQSIYMVSGGLTFEAGTFSGMPNLQSIYIQYNHHNHIPKGLIELTEQVPGTVNLDANDISSIAVGGITGLSNGYLHLAYNFLQEVPEAVFQPILAGGATLDLTGNPLSCGCDIAWIVTNPNYMTLMESGAMCSDGELLADLDPVIFEHLCPPDDRPRH